MDSRAKGGGLIIGAAIAALFYWLMKQTTSASQTVTSSSTGALDPSLGVQFLDWNNPMSTQQPSIAAFLYAIRQSENGDPNIYNQYYGGSFFNDMSNHPVLTGEKQPIPLSDAMCKAAGMGPGCVTTAAGAYQITRSTWLDLQRWGDGTPLPNFSPASQDAAAIRILQHDGAYDALMNGDLTQAIAIASGRWASLPYSTAGQHPEPAQTFLAFYNDGLAALG